MSHCDPPSVVLLDLNKQLEAKQEEMLSKKDELKKIANTSQANSERISFPQQEVF